MSCSIVDYMKRLWNAGLTTSLGGNISVRTEDGKILITPSSIDKGKLTVDDIVALNNEGEVISGKHKPSMEYMMHISVFRRRPDISAIIHAHPFYSTLYSASDKTINLNFTAEACKNIKKVAIARYEMAGSIELANAVADESVSANVILMKNHGVLTVGKTLLDAFYRMEVLEQAAKMSFCSLSLKMNELTAETINTLKAM